MYLFGATYKYVKIVSLTAVSIDRWNIKNCLKKEKKYKKKL